MMGRRKTRRSVRCDGWTKSDSIGFSGAKPHLSTYVKNTLHTHVNDTHVHTHYTNSVPLDCTSLPRSAARNSALSK